MSSKEMKDVCYTLVDSSCFQKMSESNVKHCLEHGNLESKRNALKEIIVSTANGETNQSYLILIIRFILPIQDHTVKKLLMIFWELYPKTGSDGELVKEMILVCDAFRKDLQHPNEYMRGATLRFLCKLKQPDILEPLIGSVRACLAHKRPYVRRNAVLAVYSIYKSYENLIPDAPELIEEFLKIEQDTSCKRNAFIMLLNTDIDKAVDYLIKSLDQVPMFDQSLQIVVIELIQKICQKNSHEKSAFIRCIYSLLDSKSHAVRYEAARALIMLTNSPTALKATVSCYIDIVLKASDNTTKLIVIDRIVEMKYRLPQKRILQECVADILGLLPKNKDLKIKIKIVNLVLDLIAENNVEQIVNILKKECSKDEFSAEYINYKVLINQKLHDCYLKFPSTANDIVLFFNNLLAFETDEKILLDILTLLREAAQKFDQIRTIIVNKLKISLYTIFSLELYSKALWIIVEFTDNNRDLEMIVHDIYETVREMLDYIGKNEHVANKAADSKTPNDIQNVRSYDIENGKELKPITKPLLEDITNNTGYRATSVGASVGKSLLRLKDIRLGKIQDKSQTLSKGMYVITALLHLNKTYRNHNSYQRLANWIVLMRQPKEEIIDRFLTESRSALSKMLQNQHVMDQEEKERMIQVMQPDEPICMLESSDRSFKHIQFDYFDDGEVQERQYKFDKILQLTGLSDPIYSETKLVHTSEQNIALHIMLVNRTNTTLQNCSVELASSGDIVITDKPQSKTIGPKGRTEIIVNIRVALTGNSILFGNIVYDTSKTTEHTTIVLNDIPIDIIDYIKPTDCEQDDFRKMWIEFEWENRVCLVSKRTVNLEEFQRLVSDKLHMKCLTPVDPTSGQCRFLTANLHGESIFGEVVIANLSLEKDEEKRIKGHIRLRSVSQGIVLGLGDIIRDLEY